MKNFVKLFVVVIAITMTTELSAQDFGVKAGLNLSNMLLEGDFGTYSDLYKIKPGFHLGATADFPITEMFSFETGLLLSTKGFRIDEESSFMNESYKFEGKMNLFYLDIPLTAKASYNLGGTTIYGVFGPYVGMGLCGKSRFEAIYTGEKDWEEEDIKFGSDQDKDDLKRLDYGLTVGAGIEVNSIQIGINYGLGLANISLYTEEGTKQSNRVLGLSIGYKFSQK